MASEPIKLHRGEKRLLSLAMGGSLASGDSLTGTPTLRAYRNRGKVDVSAGETGALIEDTPTAPVLAGENVQFWTVAIPLDYPASQTYTVEAECDTTNGETIVERMRLVVI